MNYSALGFATLLIFLSGCGEAGSSSPEASRKARPSIQQQEVPLPAPPKASQVASPDRLDVAPPATAPRLSIGPDGLRWFLEPNGSSRALPFGMAEAEVLASLEKTRGRATRGSNADCGAGPAAFAGWPDGLSLLFQDGRFAGWGLDRRAKGGIGTADGIGIGSTRAQLDDAMGPPLQVRRTTLGMEFSAGEYHGLFSNGGPDAEITDLWAGVNCVAR